jgi:oligopeptide/dipeptide ABC transporter ATP-binding protein
MQTPFVNNPKDFGKVGLRLRPSNPEPALEKGATIPPLLEVRDLTIHFIVRRRLGSPNVVVHAADNVSLYVYRGETLGLVGESGSGKTTIGRGTLRLIEPTSGDVFLNGQNITKLRGRAMRDLRRKMQMVFQDPTDSLNPRFTCRQTLIDALAHAGCKPKERLYRAIELIESVGLEVSDLDKYPHQFSGGQQQRIAIARVLAFTPELLILDEPTASLDVSVKTQVTQLLRDLQKKFNLSFILISHDLSNVKYMTDRVAVMYLGQIVEVGNTCDIFSYPLHPYTRILIDSVPVPDPTLIRKRLTLVGEIPSATAPPTGCRFHTRCPFRKEICDKIEPHMVRLDGGRMVACHLY